MTRTPPRRWFRTAVLLGLLFTMATPGFGQTITATVTGTVTDNTGAVLTSVVIVAVNQNTQVEYPTKTNQAGVYTITGLPVGPYVVRAEGQQRFKGVNTNPITLDVGQTARVDLTLELGNLSEVVEVRGIAPILQTESAIVGEVITGSTATALPLNGRNFAQLTLLVPGVITPKPDSFMTPKSGDDSGRPYVNGHREQGNNFTLDGFDANEAIDNLIAYYPSPDALAEIRVETNNYSAEFGNVAGAMVSAVMKSGTNEFHGNAFEFLRNDKFDANSWLNNRSGAAKAELKQHIFGGTVGGPIIRNRMFFFGDYQGTRVDRPGGATAAVAPEAWRRGDFSSLLASGTIIRDPATGQPFPGNQVPTTRFSAAARALFADTARYPLPSRAGLEGNLIGEQMETTRNHQGDVKVDLNLNAVSNMFVRASFGNYDTTRSQNPFQLQLGTAYKSTNQSVAGHWTRVVGSAAFNELRVGFSRVTIEDLRNGGGIDWAGVGNYNQTLGIPGNQAIAGVSEIRWNSAGIDNVGSPAPVSDTNDRVFQVSEKLAFSRGRHYISTGGQWLYSLQDRAYASNSGVLGFFQFSGQFTGFAFTDFLLDQVAAKGIGGSTPWGQRQSRIGLFIQDDFKARSNLTVNLGLRWDYMSPLVEKEDRQVTYNLDTGQAVFAGDLPTALCASFARGCVQSDNRGLYDPFYGGFAPRLGLAWNFMPKSVLRGAYGIVQYMEGTGANNRLSQNSPFVPVDSVVNYTTRAGTMTTGFQDTAAGAPAALGVGQLRVVQPDLRPQFTHQWNVFYERELSSSTSANIGYVGHKATHLITFKDFNQAVPGVGDPSTWVDSEQRRRLRNVLPNAGPVRYTASDGESDYHGLQTSMRQRPTGGLEFLASYTYSRSMTDNQGFYGPGWGSGTYTHFNTGIGDGNQNSYDPDADYGPTAFDVRHNLSLSGTYQLPIGQGRKVGSNWSGAKQSVLGGWNVSTIFTARSGFPVTVTNGWNNRSLQPNFAYQRPNVVGDPEVDSPDWDRWINLNAFGEAPLGTFGLSPVGVLRGPGFWNVDFGLDKNFLLGGDRLLAFRVEAFNLFNHPNKGMPVRDWSNKAQFGRILNTANSQRILEFAFKFHF